MAQRRRTGTVLRWLLCKTIVVFSLFTSPILYFLMQATIAPQSAPTEQEKQAATRVIGALALDIRGDWSCRDSVIDRCESIEWLASAYNIIIPELDSDVVMMDGRWMRNVWGGPYGWCTLEDLALLKLDTDIFEAPNWCVEGLATATTQSIPATPQSVPVEQQKQAAINVIGALAMDIRCDFADNVVARCNLIEELASKHKVRIPKIDYDCVMDDGRWMRDEWVSAGGPYGACTYKDLELLDLRECIFEHPEYISE